MVLPFLLTPDLLESLPLFSSASHLPLLLKNLPFIYQNMFLVLRDSHFGSETYTFTIKNIFFSIS